MTRRSLLAFGLVMLATSAATAPAATLGAAETSVAAVVVSKSFPLDELSFGDLRRLYSGSPVVAAGKLLVPFTYPKHSSERVEFDHSVLGMSEDDVGRYWIDRKIRGQSGPPRVVDSPEVLLKVVTKVDGAIGYVKATAFVAGVKVLRIDGKLPKDPGYRVSF
jgi:hypothetical protein